MLPSELTLFVPFWPNINEDHPRADGQAWRLQNARAEPSAQSAEMAAHRSRQYYSGQAATAMAVDWNRIGAGGNLTQATAAARTAPVLLDGFANVVSGVKVFAATQAASTAVQVATLVALGGAVGATAAHARTIAGRAAVARGMRVGAEGAGRLSPILERFVTGPLRALRFGGRGPGGGPALATAGGRVPGGSMVPRMPAAPRSFKDGMAQMSRGRGGGRGGGGGRSGWRGQSHKFKGSVPKDTSNMTKEQAEELEKKLAQSVDERTLERKWFNTPDPGHEHRLESEKKALGRIRRFLGKDE
ncbi:hypothetical protein [Nonomuraea rhizosphaerae]|uniref:hypothetical protein n=1 Tax=Nonomuraea rhizosphaerae TaxID=2665663 RepID=UPI001C5FAB49|nr:hypothetical protein [Nonomuraea rhizosphaerae]